MVIYMSQVSTLIGGLLYKFIVLGLFDKMFLFVYYIKHIIKPSLY